MASGAWERHSLHTPTPCQVMDFNRYITPVAQGEGPKKKMKTQKKPHKKKNRQLRVRRARNNCCDVILNLHNE